MVEGRGESKMTARMRKFAKILAEGFTLSAQATAWREGLPWEPETRRRSLGDRRGHQKR
jgi:hypothetical protein